MNYPSEREGGKKRRNTITAVGDTDNHLPKILLHPCEQLHLDTLLPTLAMLQTTPSNGLSKGPQESTNTIYTVQNCHLSKPQAEKLSLLTNVITPLHVHVNKAKGHAEYDRRFISNGLVQESSFQASS